MSSLGLLEAKAEEKLQNKFLINILLEQIKNKFTHFGGLKRKVFAKFQMKYSILRSLWFLKMKNLPRVRAVKFTDILELDLIALQCSPFLLQIFPNRSRILEMDNITTEVKLFLA